MVQFGSITVTKYTFYPIQIVSKQLYMDIMIQWCKQNSILL